MSQEEQKENPLRKLTAFDPGAGGKFGSGSLRGLPFANHYVETQKKECKCKHCSDTGYVIAGQNATAYTCLCEHGRSLAALEQIIKNSK